MPYTDFHYVPTGTGVISGKEVLEQTEDAINYLEQQTAAGVDQAIDTANNAMNTANTAMADAQNAVNTANTAYTAATNAQNTANAAQTTATNAQNAAAAAQNDVDALENVVTGIDGRLTTTEGNVTNLTTRMGIAEGNITTLQNDVITAQGTATSAQNTATLAREQAYVTRYTNTAVSDNSTIAYANITNTDNIKVNDLLLDTNGKLYQISSVDTSNETVSVTTPLTQLAVDSDVVHKSGNETATGFKTFENIRLTNSIRAISLDSETVDINNCYSSFAPANSPKNGNVALYSCNTDDGTANITNLPEQKAFYLISITIRYLANSPTVKQILFTREDVRYERFCSVGTWGNWVKNTDKFVTTDTAQTISGTKTFLDVPIPFKSSSAELGVTGGNTRVILTDKNLLNLAGITFGNYGSSKLSYCRLCIYDKDSNNQEIERFLDFAFVSNNQNAYFRPNISDFVSLGSTSNRWKDLYTNKINGLEPSSLSLPSGTLTEQIDISSYFTNTGSGDTNSYTAPANGWIYLYVTACKTLTAYIQSATDTLYSDYRERSSDGQIRVMLPIQKNNRFTSQWTTSSTVSITKAAFIPCQGNV